MNTTMILSKLKAKQNGSWFNVQWTSDLPLSAKAKKDGHIGYKTTTAQVRKGVKYENTKAGKIKLSAKPEGEHLGSLPWGEWKKGYEGLAITHKDKDYIRLYPGPNGSHTRYYIDETEYTYDELKASGLVNQSYFNEKEKPDVFTVKAENIQIIF